MMKQSLLVALITMSGCATVERTTLLGAGVGATAGAGLGIAVEKSPGAAPKDLPAPNL